MIVNISSSPYLWSNCLSDVSISCVFIVYVGDYDARVRVVIEQMCWLLRVDMSQVEVVEEQLLTALKNQAELSE